MAVLRPRGRIDAYGKNTYGYKRYKYLYMIQSVYLDGWMDG